MTRFSKNKKRCARKRWLPFFAVGIAGLHMLAFLLLAQCSALAPGYNKRVSYIRSGVEESGRDAFEFKPPPERMFYQYASMSLGGDEEKPLPLEEPHWDGYQTLVALRADGYTPITNYRLTMEMQQGAGSPRQVHYHYREVFRPILIRGIPMQPVSQVPEPSSAFLVLFSLFSVCCYRRRY